MRHWRLTAIVVGAYALGLIAMAPATLIDAMLGEASAGRLHLAEAGGTLWSGSGQLEMRDANRRTAIARDVAWRLRPASVLRARFDYDVTLDHAVKPFPVTISVTRIEVADADIHLPAAALAAALPKLAPLELTGDMVLHVVRLGFGRSAIEGNATLQWRAAGSALTRVFPLGDYELRLDADGSAVRASLRTLQGPVQIEGRGSWVSGGNPELQATARVPSQHQQQLAPLLRLIAVERGDGSFALQLK